MFGFEDGWLAHRVLFLLPVVAALTVHEFAHAWAAFRLGDDTAAREGRLTLNPVEHIDPLGLMVPLLGVPFGWARPVPVNPGRFGRGVSLGTGVALTAAAGPLANILLALFTVAGMGAWAAFDPTAPDSARLWAQLELFVLLNAMLALFNLLPLPPLDGSRIADAFMPQSLRPAWDGLASLGVWGIALVLVVPLFAGVNLFAWPMGLVQSTLDAVVALATGA